MANEYKTNGAVLLVSAPEVSSSVVEDVAEDIVTVADVPELTVIVDFEAEEKKLLC